MASQPDLPIPISYISSNYYLFSIDAVTYLRREHHICGVLIGTLPQIPQQNVFLGLPLELMPEEARLLVEKGVAYIVDEARAHKDGMKALVENDRKAYLQDLKSQGAQAMRLQMSRKEQQREEALKQLEEKKTAKAKKNPQHEDTGSGEKQDEKQESLAPSDLFAPEPLLESRLASSRASIVSSEMAMGITPATSYPPLPRPSPAQLLPLPKVPSSYPLFAHLHSKGYFLSPGLRFGCEYLAYPGDPLRFHSHFLVVSAEWDQEIDLMDIIAGGRLGTGVKKGFLLGGAERKAEHSEAQGNDSIRTFSIEWAGM